MKFKIFGFMLSCLLVVVIETIYFSNSGLMTKVADKPVRLESIYTEGPSKEPHLADELFPFFIDSKSSQGQLYKTGIQLRLNQLYYYSHLEFNLGKAYNKLTGKLIFIKNDGMNHKIRLEISNSSDEVSYRSDLLTDETQSINFSVDLNGNTNLYIKAFDENRDLKSEVIVGLVDCVLYNDQYSTSDIDSNLTTETQNEINKKLTGNWSGRFYNGKDMGCNLVINSVNGNEINATFKFFGLYESPNTDFGEYIMTGKYDYDTRLITLYGHKWLKRPKDYQFVNIEGRLNSNFNVITTNQLTELKKDEGK